MSGGEGVMLKVHRNKKYISNTGGYILEITASITGYGNNMQGRSQDLARGGGARMLFFRFGNLHVAKQHAINGRAIRFACGVWWHAPPKFIYDCGI